MLESYPCTNLPFLPTANRHAKIPALAVLVPPSRDDFCSDSFGCPEEPLILQRN